MIGALSTLDKSINKKEDKKCQRLLAAYIDDQDPRVRQSSLKSMVRRLKTLDTIGNCQRPVFPIGVS